MRFVMEVLVMANTLYTLGYSQSGAREKLRQVIAGRVEVVDIRYVPRSARSEWSREYLAAWLGSRYQHVRELGNVNYRSAHLPIQLLDAPVGVLNVTIWLREGFDVCLLCACADVSACHRRLVADLVQAAIPCTVVHL
jgi:uncharacterized protein (DUF488 family)